MLTEMRREVRALLDGCGATRPPALRRAEDAAHLLATDAPSLLDEVGITRLRKALHAQGYSTELVRGWLLMDKALTLTENVQPPETLPAGEAGCVISLLLRHPSDMLDTESVRALAKASEMGIGALERVCAGLHRDFAARLRQGEALPGGLLPYVLLAARKTKLTP